MVCFYLLLLAVVVIWAKVDVRLEYLHPVKAMSLAASTLDISTFDKMDSAKEDNEKAKNGPNVDRHVGEYFRGNKTNTSSIEITSLGKIENIRGLKKHEQNRENVQNEKVEGLSKVNNHTAREDNRKIEPPEKIENLDKLKDYHDDWESVMNYNTHFTPHITKDLYKPGYLITNSDVCEDIHENVLVTILVISAPDHFKQREAIRNSWGKTKDNKEVVLSFLVGLSDNTTVDKAVADESAKNGDVIVNNINDSYQNLSLKTISAFAWFKQFCSKSQFLLKVDDDMFVQIDRLLELIRELLTKNEQPRLILGNISRGWKPVRNPQSKYLITEAQYPGENYPDFATGPSYLVSKSAVMEIIPVAMEEKYIHLEDVFLTGVVAERLGISRYNNEQFKNNANRVPARFMGCTLLHTITIHKVDPEEQAELTQIANNPECGKRKKHNKINQTKQKKRH